MEQRRCIFTPFYVICPSFCAQSLKLCVGGVKKTNLMRIQQNLSLLATHHNRLLTKTGKSYTCAENATMAQAGLELQNESESAQTVKSSKIKL